VAYRQTSHGAMTILFLKSTCGFPSRWSEAEKERKRRIHAEGSSAGRPGSAGAWGMTRGLSRQAGDDPPVPGLPDHGFINTGEDF
jgi:hypothetical protein